MHGETTKIIHYCGVLDGKKLIVLLCYVLMMCSKLHSPGSERGTASEKLNKIHFS